MTTEQLTVEASLKPAACIKFIMMIKKNEFIISTLGSENCLIPKQSHADTYMLNKCIRSPVMNTRKHRSFSKFMIFLQNFTPDFSD